MYSIPLIPADLRHGETVIQAGFALDLMQRQINTIFDRIDNRLSENNARVKSLTKRVEIAQFKIGRLVGTTKAIRIYSSSRFSDSHVFQDVQTTFDDKSATLTAMFGKHKQVTSQCEVLNRAYAPGHGLNEKLVFFHVRSSFGHQKPFQVKMHSQILGIMPEHQTSISSLLLFNTNERVCGSDDGSDGSSEDNNWKHAKMFKNLRTRPVLAINERQKQLLELAPPSLVNRTRQSLATLSGGLRYTPKLLEAPEIDLPLDLPDLPMIADDIIYDSKGQQQQLIAPSLHIENLPELIKLVNNENVTNMNITIGKEMHGIPSTTVNQLDSKTKSHQGVLTIGAPKPPPTPPPPPPPPPPSMLNTTFLPNQLLSPPRPPSLMVSIPSNLNDSRSELMDSIRKAGGARGGRLRSAITVNDSRRIDAESFKNQKSGTIESNKGNLMTDLHNKLLMRRKGISGAKAERSAENTDSEIISSLAIGNPVISLLSALIPPPNTSNYSDEDDEDADWTE